MSEYTIPSENTLSVPLPRMVAFVRQVTHDVRNGLNAIDLQAAFAAELAGQGEVAAELGKLRHMVTHVTADMQKLSARFGELRPILMAFPIQEMLQGLKQTVEQEFETQAKRIVWEVKVGDQEMSMDYTLLTSVLIELIRNAIFFREGDNAIHFTASSDKSNAIFELRQVRSMPLADPQTWGREPLASGRRGGYGLGLFYVRRVLDAIGGVLNPIYDSKSGEVRVRITLPLEGRGPEA
jgi:signal transduction histidine kinase